MTAEKTDGAFHPNKLINPDRNVKENRPVQPVYLSFMYSKKLVLLAALASQKSSVKNRV